MWNQESLYCRFWFESRHCPRPSSSLLPIGPRTLCLAQMKYMCLRSHSRALCDIAFQDCSTWHISGCLLRLSSKSDLREIELAASARDLGLRNRYGLCCWFLQKHVRP